MGSKIFATVLATCLCSNACGAKHSAGEEAPTLHGGGGSGASPAQVSSGAAPASTAGGTGVGGNSLDPSLSAGADGGGPLPHAHVVAVEVSGSDGRYVFSVSVRSDDIDCSQFANWWEILSENGELIYRRILLHSHTDENGTTDAGAPGNTFTRASDRAVALPSDQVVLVRAHMNTGGYRGDVLRGTVEHGFSLADDLDEDFATELEFEEPQSDTCQF